MDMFDHDEPTPEELREEAKRVYEALSKGHSKAIEAVNYWRQTAESLTTIRSSAGWHRPHLPNGPEEWWDTVELPLPFDLDEMRAEFAALSGLITKAHTISNVYADAAKLLDADATQAYAESQE